MADTIYHCNFRAQEYRPSRGANSVTFGAANDGAAAAVAAELGSWTTGQLTSLTKRIGGVGTAGPYGTGTRRTAFAHVSDATGKVYRISFRNAELTLTTNDLIALLTGVVGTDPIGSTFTALSAPPGLPGSGAVITTILDARFAIKS